MFAVEILKNKKTVSILKDLIKEKKAPHLNYIAASDLNLWKVDISLDNIEEFQNFKFDSHLMRIMRTS